MELSENGVASIEKLDGRCLSGSVLPDDGEGIVDIEVFCYLLQLVLAIFRCPPGTRHEVDGEAGGAALEAVCDNTQEFHDIHAPSSVLYGYYIT